MSAHEYKQRVVESIERTRADLSAVVIKGGMTPEQYSKACGQISGLTEALGRLEAVYGMLFETKRANGPAEVHVLKSY